MQLLLQQLGALQTSWKLTNTRIQCVPHTCEPVSKSPSLSNTRGQGRLRKLLEYQISLLVVPMGGVAVLSV